MTNDQKQELAEALSALFDLDRFSGCSDRYFRQVYTAKIKAIQACGYREALLADTNKEQREDNEL